MKNLNNPEETNDDNQIVRIKNKLKIIFNHDLNLPIETSIHPKCRQNKKD